MWCRNCNIETNEATCPVCGADTVEDLPIEIYWCRQCGTPIIQVANQVDKGICPICGKKTKYLAKDLRPVFPEERLLLEILLNKKINEFIKSSVWAVNNRYYIDGKSLSISGEMFRMADTDAIRESLEKYKGNNSYEYFEKHIETFIKANRGRLNYLKEESFEFVKNTASKFDEEKRVISFSGGKDSTVTADVVVKALSNPNLVHIFGNTTLEFPSTVAYAERYRENHPQSIFLFAKNDEQVFYDVCEDIGPPARMMRWCCSMFKTGPITRVINSLYRNQQILTFYGIRKSESVSRSKYNRVEDDAEVYVDTGKWKARQGGNGIPAAGDVKIKFTNCTTENHAKIYRLVRKFDDELLGMFTPFGRVAPELGKKLLHEVIVLDIKTNVPILSIQPFSQDGYEYAVKVRTMNVKDHDELQRMVGYQVRKFNACRKCLKCESICRTGAISISEDGYYIDPQKCVHCKMCMTAKYLDGGCMMDKYLRTK